MARVFVGLSGGVDSAVSAALLKKAGHDVVGAFIKIWRPEFIDCPWRRDRLDAMRVCAALDIPFREIDLSETYKKEVIDDMVANYARGVTPNPDVLCNRHIKFGAFATWAFQEGADLVATGHYARNEEGKLLRGKDASKDQSYFLWQLNQEDLRRALFPIGHLPKSEVRALAEKFALPVAAKKDSQGLCFVGDVSMRDFLAHYITLEKGNALDEGGDVIGEHDGAALYTLGERHGFRTMSDIPLYVIATDIRKNTVTVAPEREKAARQQVRLIQMNRLVAEASTRLTGQARYRETPIPCTLQGDIVHFEAPHLTPPGQSFVLYDGEQVVGGGIIASDA